MHLLILFGILMSLSSEIRSFPYPQPSGYGSVSYYESNPYEIDNGYRINVVSDTNKIYTPLENVGNVVNTKISQVVNSKRIQFVTPFPDTGRQKAVLELAARESLPIQADIKYGNLQQFVANLLNPKPIVDTIQEHEKYGNDGGKGRAVSTLVVNSFEGLSNVLNAVVDTPFQVIKTAGKKITETLNPLGAKLVGLA